MIAQTADAGTSPWTMLLVALVGGIVASAPSIFAAVKAWFGRKKAAEELAQRKAELELERLNREEKERQAASDRDTMRKILDHVSRSFPAITESQEAAMKPKDPHDTEGKP